MCTRRTASWPRRSLARGTVTVLSAHPTARAALSSTMAQAGAQVEVTGGVDTHKDTHTAAAADSAGLRGAAGVAARARRAGAGRDRGHRGVRLRPGPVSAGRGRAAGRSRSARPQGAAGRASPTQSTPNPPPGPRSLRSAPAPRSSARDGWKRCGRCGWPDAARSRTALTCSGSSKRWSSPPEDLRQALRGLPPASSSMSAPRRGRTGRGSMTGARRAGGAAVAGTPASAADRGDQGPRRVDRPPGGEDQPRGCSSSTASGTTSRPAPRHRRREQRPPSIGGRVLSGLCGAAPLPASSGRTHRHRLNRGGDRQANAALYRVVLCRLRWDERTRAYAARRTADDYPRPRSSAA